VAPFFMDAPGPHDTGQPTGHIACRAPSRLGWSWLVRPRNRPQRPPRAILPRRTRRTWAGAERLPASARTKPTESVRAVIRPGQSAARPVPGSGAGAECPQSIGARAGAGVRRPQVFGGVSYHKSYEDAITSTTIEQWRRGRSCARYLTGATSNGRLPRSLSSARTFGEAVMPSAPVA